MVQAPPDWVVFKVLPEMDSPVPKTTDCKFLAASLMTKEEAVKVAMLTLPREETVNWLLLPTVNSWEGEEVPMPTLPLARTVNKETPEEDATLKGFKIPLPWTLKETVEEVAPIPATVPLSIRAPLVKEEAPFQIATLPLVPEPEMPEPVALKVIWPAVVVVMVMLVPAIKLVGAYLAPVLSTPRIWPWTVGAVEVAVPPLATPRTPVTSVVKTAWPLNKAPPEVDLTKPALVKEERVVEPVTVKVPEPVVEAK